MVDEQVHLRRRSWDVRVGVEVGDALLGEHVLAQDVLPVQSRPGCVITA